MRINIERLKLLVCYGHIVILHALHETLYEGFDALLHDRFLITFAMEVLLHEPIVTVVIECFSVFAIEMQDVVALKVLRHMIPVEGPRLLWRRA